MNKNDDNVIESFKIMEFRQYVLQDLIDSLISALPEEEQNIASDIIYGEAIKNICKKYGKTRNAVKRIQLKLQKLYKTNY